MISLSSLRKKLKPAQVQVVYIPNGPFKGRLYARKEDGTLGMRLRQVSPGNVAPFYATEVRYEKTRHRRMRIRRTRRGVA